MTPELVKEFEALDCSAQRPQDERKAQDPEKAVVACDPANNAKYILGPLEIPGTDIDDASYGTATNQQGMSTGQYAVNLQFNSEGTQTFKELSERLYQIGQSQQATPAPSSRSSWTAR